ncbi:MAG: hypothetical protein Greene041679_392 [Parcubacteria group bacterium Greene0416_79]|nr:MAG: hypothetical protein Greene041679_392 [Parcubacteria group bacterium Greene0416_79]
MRENLKFADTGCLQMFGRLQALFSPTCVSSIKNPDLAIADKVGEVLRSQVQRT